MKKILFLSLITCMIAASQPSWWQRLIGRQQPQRSATQLLAQKMLERDFSYFVPQAGGIPQPNTIWSNHLFSGILASLTEETETIKVDGDFTLEFSRDDTTISIKLLYKEKQLVLHALYSIRNNNWRLGR